MYTAARAACAVSLMSLLLLSLMKLKRMLDMCNERQCSTLSGATSVQISAC